MTILQEATFDHDTSLNIDCMSTPWLYFGRVSDSGLLAWNSRFTSIIITKKNDVGDWIQNMQLPERLGNEWNTKKATCLPVWQVDHLHAVR